MFWCIPDINHFVNNYFENEKVEFTTWINLIQSGPYPFLDIFFPWYDWTRSHHISSAFSHSLRVSRIFCSTMSWCISRLSIRKVAGINAPPPACLFFTYFWVDGGFTDKDGSPLTVLSQTKTMKKNEWANMKDPVKQWTETKDCAPFGLSWGKKDGKRWKGTGKGYTTFQTM